MEPLATSAKEGTGFSPPNSCKGCLAPPFVTHRGQLGPDCGSTDILVLLLSVILEGKEEVKETN